MENARVVGGLLKTKCEALLGREVVAVRGRGLFVGVELASTQLADKVLEGMLRRFKILASLDGPKNSVLVLKPPLVWGVKEVECFVGALEMLIRTDQTLMG